MRKVLLVDGNSIINRAFYGMNQARHLSDKSGRPTGAVYTFMNMLLAVMADYEFTYLAICFDRKEKTFRHLKYDEYKAQRKPMPEELAVQLAILKDLLKDLKIKTLELAGFEADDLIGTLSRICSEEKIACYILSGDRDDHQLLNEYVSQIYPSKGSRILITEENLPEHYYGLTANKVVDFKAIMGDNSDNIPGVKGLGEKAASSLLTEYESLDQIYEHLDEVKPAQKKKLIEGKEMAYLSRDLATIDKNVDIAKILTSIDELNFDGIKGPEARTALLDLGFRKICERLNLDDSEEVEVDLTILYLEFGAYSDLLSKILSTEDSGRVGKINLYVSLSTSKQIEVMYFLFKHNDCYYLSSLVIDSNEKRIQLAKVVSLDNIVICSYKLKELLKRFKYYQIREYFDPYIANYLLGNMDKVDSALELRELLLNRSAFTVEQIISLLSRNSKSHGNLNSDYHIDALELTNEVIQNLDIVIISELLACSEVSVYLRDEIASRGAEKLAYEIEMPLIPILAEMESNGVLIDKKFILSLDKEFEDKIQSLEDEIFSEVQHEFNLKSPQQLSVVLFEELKYEAGKKSSTGHYSTAADVLEALAEEHELVQKILDHRKLSKLQSTFIQALQKDLDEEDRVHTTFHQALTNTGRLSSSDPNLQNIPIKSDEGRRIREAFIASPGNVLLDADYSQIELRLLAEISHDINMIEAFKNGRDIHAETARALFSTSENITAQQRSHAKVVNFSIVYGVSEFGLSRTLDIPFAAARRYINNFYNKHKEIKEYMDSLIEEAKENNYVETIFKRRRYTSEIKQGNFNQRKAAERAAMNMPIQGTAADLMKFAMVKVKEAFVKNDIPMKMLLQVHDELLIEVPEVFEQEARSLLKETMESVVDFSVPLLVELGSGKNWGMAH